MLAILATLFSIVAPLSQQQVSRAEAQSEWLKLKALLSELPSIAFIRGESIKLQLAGSSAILTFDNAVKKEELVFEHIFFSPQTIHFNNHGFADTGEIQARVRQQTRELEIGKQRIPGLGQSAAK